MNLMERPLQRRRARTSHRRRARLESLESRRLLAADAALPIHDWAYDEFTVRRDEPAPVEIHLNRNAPYSFHDGGAVTVDVIDSGNGSITVPEDGGSHILYQPEPGFVGVDLISVKVTPDATSADGSTIADKTNVTEIAINVVEPLLAVDDWFSMQIGQEQLNEDGQLSLDVLGNDLRNANYIGEYPELTVESISVEDDANVAISDDGKHLLYTPSDGFMGVHTVQYTVIDTDGYTATGNTQIRVHEEAADRLWPEQLRQQLLQRAVSQNQFYFGVGTSRYQRGYHFENRFDDFVGLDIAEQAPVQDTSGTNNQIAEVDESDRIKTDGDYLYVLSTPEDSNWMGWDIFPWIGLPRFGAGTSQSSTDDNGENMLTVVDIQSPANPVIVSRKIFADEVLSLDLSDDRLSVIAQRDDNTVLTTLDVSDAADIQTISTTLIDGRFKQARRVAGSLYLFTDQYGSSTPEHQSIDAFDGKFAFFETGQQYLDRVRDSLVETATPSQSIYDGEGNFIERQSASIDLLDTGILNGHSLNILTFDTSLDVGGSIDWDINEGGSTILVTTESIYVTQTDYQTHWPLETLIDTLDFIIEPPTISTVIDRYELQNDGTVVAAASGAVPGTLKNSFSLSEFEGNLRIATEDSWSPREGGPAGSSVYVLEQSSSDLDVIGATDRLAPGERIYAVRFAGERGYVVTFRQVDPLFVLDLSDPTDPLVRGELKVPGYSQYLHVLNDTQVVGVGRDADPDTGLYQGMTVSVFDVADADNPALQDRYLFDGGRSTFSPFAGSSPFDLHDHHAISFFGSEGILALPYYSNVYGGTQIDDEDPNAPIFSTREQSAVATFRINADSNAENVIVPLDDIQFDSRADRAMRVGDYLYSLSQSQLKVTHLTQPDGVMASLDFQREGADDFVETNIDEEVLVDVTENDKIDIDSVIEILAASLVDGEGEVTVVDGKRLQFKPQSGRLSPSRVSYTARNEVGTLISAVTTIDPDLVWQNARDRFDINDDGELTPRDILNVINTIADHGAIDTESIEAAIENTARQFHFYSDTNGDDYITPDDILQVINRIAESSSQDGLESIPFIIDQSFDISLNQPAQNTTKSLQLTLTNVIEDSRCPTGANCVWPGQVRVEIEVIVDNVTSVTTLTYQPGQSIPSNVGNYQIALDDVAPKPESDDSLNAADYRFSLRVSFLDSLGSV